MPRGLTAAQKATARQRLVRASMFVFVDIPGDPIYAWDGAERVTILGHAWLGVGQLGFVSGLGSERAIRSQSIEIGIHGVPSDDVPNEFIAKTRTVDYQKRAVEIRMCFTDPDADLPLSDPWIMWRGVADVMTFKSAKSISVSMRCENFSSHLRRTNGLSMSNESHIARFGDIGDNMYRFINRLLAKSKSVL